MIGIPFFAGFGSKFYLAMAAMTNPAKKWFMLFALAVSTVLNAIYYTKALVVIFSKDGDTAKRKQHLSYVLGMGVFIAANVLLGLFYQQFFDVISTGIKLF